MNNPYHSDRYDSDEYRAPNSKDGKYADDHNTLSFNDTENGTAWNSNVDSGVGLPQEFMDVFFHHTNSKLSKQLRMKEAADVVPGFNDEYVTI